jgi:hypothetical protein
MKLGLPVSTFGHAAILIWALVSFSAKTFDASSESMLVDVVSNTEFSQLTAGSEKAQKVAAPKPVVDKVADEQNPVKDPTLKISNKPPIEATSEGSPPPPDPAPEPTQAKPAEPSADAIAEALQKEQAKQLEEQKRLQEQKKVEEQKKREEAKKRAEAKRIEEAKRREDAKKLEQKITEVLDKRDPRREAATGAVANQVASLGVTAPTSTAPSLSQSEMAAMIAKLSSEWTVLNKCIVRVHIQLGRDRRLTAPPEIVGSSGTDTQCEVAGDSAKRAVLSAQPFDMLQSSTYDAWHDMEINFDPAVFGHG